MTSLQRRGLRTLLLALESSGSSGTFLTGSVPLPSAAISGDVDNSFKLGQRHYHDQAHTL